MKIVLQRVKEASVSVDGHIVGQIGRGFLLLVGVSREDTSANAEKLAAKITSFRIFEDSDGKMNLDIKESGGTVLSVPQFTLAGDTYKGNRPGFDHAASPPEAKKLWLEFNQNISDRGILLETGKFGAKMDVSLVNDGPVTFVLEA